MPGLRPRPLAWDGGGLPGTRPAVMAILNVTPDSFFDGGRFSSTEAAVARAWEAAREGADVLDVGGESTRPGSDPVDVDVELARVLPVLEALASGPVPYPLPISIDTTKAGVARAALRAGARIVNDTTGGLADPDVLGVAAEAGAALVLMHARGTPRTMQRDVRYDDLLAGVTTVLAERCRAATAAGVPAERQAIDPGIGFGKSPEGCLQLVARLDRLEELERPVLVGASRKSFLFHLFGHAPDDRMPGSLAVAVAATLNGASILRVHDVAATRRAVDVAAAIRGLSA